MFQPRRFFHADSTFARVPVAISACLTGERVRYDGEHKQLPQWEQVLAPALHWLPVCPEAGAGLGVPRPPVQLVATDGHSIRALGRDDPDLDVTDTLEAFAHRSVAELRGQEICGYLWQSRSPSCGNGSTPVFDSARNPIGMARGIQAERVFRQLPWLACAEDTAVATTAGAWHFVLRCRLVFDVVRTAPEALPALHRHYVFLGGEWRAGVADALEEAAQASDRTGYLTEFSKACESLAAERLLALFSH